MFASNKPKNVGALAAKSTTNSRKQFVAALNASYDSAESLLNKNSITVKNLKQTKLNYGNITKKPKIENVSNVVPVAPEQYSKPEFFLLPLPQPKAVPATVQMKENFNRIINVTTNVDTREEYVDEDSNGKMSALTTNPILIKNGRNKICLIGRVDFCLKMRKVHPTMDALWDVYGQLKKVTKGKQRSENILLLRNADGGPVLQCVYYDFMLNGFEAGCLLRVVGRFVGENRLHSFKLEQLTEEIYLQWIEYFVRIQNVITFTLLQIEE